MSVIVDCAIAGDAMSRHAIASAAARGALASHVPWQSLTGPLLCAWIPPNVVLHLRPGFC